MLNKRHFSAIYTMSVRKADLGLCACRILNTSDCLKYPMISQQTWLEVLFNAPFFFCLLLFHLPYYCVVCCLDLKVIGDLTTETPTNYQNGRLGFLLAVRPRLRGVSVERQLSMRPATPQQVYGTDENCSYLHQCHRIEWRFKPLNSDF